MTLHKALDAKVIDEIEHRQLCETLENVKGAMPLDTVPSPAKDYQHTLHLLHTTFASYKQHAFYQILVDYCSLLQSPVRNDDREDKV